MQPEFSQRHSKAIDIVTAVKLELVGSSLLRLRYTISTNIIIIHWYSESNTLCYTNLVGYI
jgi:hypothetical protein